MKGYWIFPSITSLLCAVIVLEGYSRFFVFLAVLWFIRLLAMKHKQLLIISLLCGGSVAFLAVQMRFSMAQSLVEEQEEFIVALKPTSVIIDGDRLRFYGRIDLGEKSEEIVVRYRLNSEEEKQQWMNDPLPISVQINGQLTKPHPARNWYQFDYQEYLKRASIHWILDAEAIQPKGASTKHVGISYTLDRWRNTVLDQVDRNVSGLTADYIKAMLLADRRSLSEETVEQFRVLGIVHVLSISGLHIQFLINGFRRVLLKLGITRESTHWFLLLILPLYGILAGFGASIFRAVIQTVLSIVFMKIGRPQEAIDYWALTLLLAIMIQPTIIYGIGFQLSYLLSGLLLMFNHTILKKEGSLWKKTILLSLMINLASIPILTYHFYEFPWGTFLANLLVIPLFTWGVLPLLATVLLFSILFSGTPLFIWLNEGSNQFIRGLEWGIRSSESLPFSTFVTGRLSLFAYMTMCVALWIIFYGIEKEQKVMRSTVVGVVLFSFAIFSERYSPIGQVVMLDVGQGESIVVKEPYGQQTYLIDTGGQVSWWEKEEWQEQEAPFSLGKDTVVPALKALGVDHLDVIYLSHADMDHVGALLDIIEAIPTTTIHGTQATFLDQNIQEILPTLKEDTVELEIITAPMQVDKELFLLYPWEVTSGRNEDSLVLYGTIGEYTWLFTGDLEEEGERQLIQRYPQLTTDILKVGHHGSQTSTKDFFLKKIQPQEAWISSGVNNQYGHPHPEVLEQLATYEVNTYRTDTHGAIRYRYVNHPMLHFLINEPTEALIE